MEALKRRWNSHGSIDLVMLERRGNTLVYSNEEWPHQADKPTTRQTTHSHQFCYCTWRHMQAGFRQFLAERPSVGRVAPRTALRSATLPVRHELRVVLHGHAKAREPYRFADILRRLAR